MCAPGDGRHSGFFIQSKVTAKRQKTHIFPVLFFSFPGSRESFCACLPEAPRGYRALACI